MNDDVEVEDWMPVSIVMKDNSRLLGYADFGGEIVRVRGTVEYHVEMHDSGPKTFLRDYDPATDDEYIVFDFDDMYCMNLMSKQFHAIYMDYHHKKNSLDFEKYATKENLIFENYGVPH